MFRVSFTMSKRKHRQGTLYKHAAPAPAGTLRSGTSCRPLRSRISDLRCDLQITVRELQGALLIWFFNTLLCVSIWCEHGSGIGAGIDPA